MFELLQAERIKLTRHRAAWLTVWIFPIGLALAAVLGTAQEIIQPGKLEPMATAAAWIANQAGVWEALTNPLARYLIAAFTAVAFGGEYGWNTWKLIAPHRERAALLMSKYVVLLAMLATAAVLLVIVHNVGQLVNDVLTNEPTPPGVRFGAFMAAQGPSALIAAIVITLTVAYASTAAVLTRSTMAGAIIGIVLVSVEQAQRLLVIKYPEIYHWTPLHHVTNLSSWIGSGKAATIPIDGQQVADPGQLSAAYVAVLIAGLVAVTIAAFRRQDLN